MFAMENFAVYFKYFLVNYHKRLLYVHLPIYIEENVTPFTITLPRKSWMVTFGNINLNDFVQEGCPFPHFSLTCLISNVSFALSLAIMYSHVPMNS